MASIPPTNPLEGVPSHITALLDRLHTLSSDQEASIDPSKYQSATIHDVMRDKFIALDQDKSQCVYTLLRAIDARTVVEAGTSYGVSTIYLALAAAANAAAGGGGKPARVIATEHEPAKAAKAREHWAECGAAVSSVIDLREGDLLETLKQDVEDVDFLLLDIWTPMAFPTLKLIQPKMRRGAIVVIDNTIKSAKGYTELLTYLRSPESGFINLTLPYSNGLEMCVYAPKQ